MVPKFNPEQYVIFDNGGGVKLGQIKGGAFYANPRETEPIWQYAVDDGNSNTGTYHVAEDKITHYFNGKDYINASTQPSAQIVG